VLGWLIEVKVSLISKKLFGSKVPTLGYIVNLSPQVNPILELGVCELKSKLKAFCFDMLYIIIIRYLVVFAFILPKSKSSIEKNTLDPT
jgi:hypothetical protein